VVLALQDAPQHERAWDRGGEGEESVAESLAKRCHAGVFVLHDRRVPQSRANIDHVAVAPAGVWVIDTKRYKGKVAVRRPLLGQTKLTIDGRDCSKLMDRLEKQVELVRSAVEEIAPDVPVHGTLCMVDADLPLLGALTFRGYPLLWRKALAKRLNAPGPLDATAARALGEELAKRFPPA
jgi:Nuclease-related domain